MSRIKIYLTILGMDPDEISRRVGLRPRKAIASGSTLRSGLLAEKGVWDVCVEAEEQESISDAFRRLFSSFEEHWDDLVALVTESDTTVEVEIAIYAIENDRTPDLVLESDVMGKLGQVTPMLQISIY